MAFQTLLATLQDCPMMQRNYEDIHPITKQINQQTFINPYKNISHKSVTIQTTSEAGLSNDICSHFI